jgi:putative peptide zinc metalloprotease protein
MTRSGARHFFSTTLALVFAFLGAVTVLASGDNTAIAINTKDNSDVFRLAFKIERLNGDVVTPTNLSFAFASCTDCQTVAIAIQAVLVTTDPSPNYIQNTNEAWAINYMCSGCDTLSYAYQFFDTVGGKFMITPEGRQEIARIRQEFESLRHSNDLAYIQAQARALTAELQQVLTTQVVPVGDHSTPAGESPSASPAASPAESPSASPSPSEAPSESPSPSASPS